VELVLPDADPDPPVEEPELVTPELAPEAEPELAPDEDPELPLLEESSDDDEHAAKAITATVSNKREQALMAGFLLPIWWALSRHSRITRFPKIRRLLTPVWLEATRIETKQIHRRGRYA
jgi:hypothetical protein